MYTITIDQEAFHAMLGMFVVFSSLVLLAIGGFLFLGFHISDKIKQKKHQKKQEDLLKPLIIEGQIFCQARILQLDKKSFEDPFWTRERIQILMDYLFPRAIHPESYGIKDPQPWRTVLASAAIAKWYARH